MEKFFIGLHQESDAWAFQNCMISFNRLQPRGNRAARKAISGSTTGFWIRGLLLKFPNMGNGELRPIRISKEFTVGRLAGIYWQPLPRI